MFFKSCNCNSSIATRVGFAVCAFDTPASFIDSLPDNFLPQLHSSMDYEDRPRHQTHREMESQLHQDGL
jgi:hypothetical protein